MPVTWLRRVPTEISTARFVSGAKLHEALLQDRSLSKLVPDSFGEGYRQYVLDIINSYTGSEFELFLKVSHLEILRFAKRVGEDTHTETNLYEPADFEEYKHRLDYQKELYALKP